MEKENWLKRITSTNRFWGLVLIAVGSGLTLVPGLQVIGPVVVAGGIGQFSVGAVNKVNQMREDKAAAKEGSSDQK